MSPKMSHEEDEAREFLRWLGDEYDPASADELPRLTALLRAAFVRGFEAGRDAAADRFEQIAAALRDLADNAYADVPASSHQCRAEAIEIERSVKLIRALVAPEGP